MPQHKLQHKLQDTLRLTTQQKWIGLILFLSVLPYFLTLTGADFSSTSTLLTVDQFANGKIKADQVFHALKGALHHTLLEWSAVSVAVIAAFASFLHYSLRRDITIPIIGMALLCAGFMDAFHTLAATRMIEANAPNSGFIPFTWALSRIFNASIMIIGVGINIWIFQQSKDLDKYQPNRKKEFERLVNNKDSH